MTNYVRRQLPFSRRSSGQPGDKETCPETSTTTNITVIDTIPVPAEFLLVHPFHDIHPSMYAYVACVALLGPFSLSEIGSCTWRRGRDVFLYDLYAGVYASVDRRDLDHVTSMTHVFGLPLRPADSQTDRPTGWSTARMLYRLSL